jgi:protein-disulfide isomerase
MQRDAVQHELALVRQRRQNAIYLAAELARDEAALKARLDHDLDGDTPADRAARDVAERVRLERRYGTVHSAAALTATMHVWRKSMPLASSLSTLVQPNRDHVRGDPAARVVVVEYGDYECTECAEAHDLFSDIRHWVDDGRMCAAFRHFPLVHVHPSALRAAQAVEAAATQGRFWEMHHQLMQYGIVNDRHQQRIVMRAPRNMRELERAALQAGLDLPRFRSDIDEPAVLERILEDVRGGLASGVNGTPTFYVDGERVDISGVEELYAFITNLINA